VILPSKEPQPNREEQQSVPDKSTETARGEPPMDRWFDEQLTQLFKNVVNEPMPSDLADLIGKLKAQEQDR
jgi:hypothetical protein